MNDPTKTEREIPEDIQRKQIMTLDVVRRYLRDLTDETTTTYSQQIDEWLPEDDVFHEIDDGDVTIVKVVPEIHERVMGMCGKRVKPGEVIAYYAMLDALERGDAGVAAEIAKSIPETLWNAMGEEDG